MAPAPSVRRLTDAALPLWAAACADAGGVRAMGERLIATCAREVGNELIRAECESLTGGTPDARGIARCETIDYVGQAAYVRWGLRVIACAATLDQLVADVGQRSIDADRFRIECWQLPPDLSTSRREVVVRIADALRGARPDLDSPRHRFCLTASESGFEFAEVLAASTHSYRQHEAKPHRTSSSLPTRLSRAAVNLVARTARRVLDPCCGAGSLLLEACSLGLETRGSDWNPRMVHMSRGNVGHFGYGVPVELVDARESPEAADAVVTNLPYGRNLQIDRACIRGILDRMAQAAPVGVYIAAEDMSEWLYEAGYCNVAVYRVRKSTGFVRLVHHASREPSRSLP